MSLWKKRTVSGLIAGLDIFQSLWDSTDVCLSSVDQDHFSEVLFHVSSITNLKKQDKRRFSIYFKKKRYDFMAHSEGKVKEKEGRYILYCLLVLPHDFFYPSEVYDGWVTSLLASRGQPSPPPPELHGQIMMKDTRSRAYAAVWGHDLWIYPNKEGFQLGVASFSVPLNVATVKSTGKHSFTLITPFKTFKYLLFHVTAHLCEY